MKAIQNTYQQFLFCLSILLVGFIILIPKIPLITLGKVPIRAEDILSLFVFTLWFLYLALYKRKKEFFQNKLFVALLLFILSGFLTTVITALVLHTISLESGVLRDIRSTELVLFLPLALTVIKNKKQRSTALVFLSLCTFGTLCYMLGQKFLHFPIFLPSTTDTPQSAKIYIEQAPRLSGTFDGYFDFGVFLLMTLSFFSAFFFSVKNALLKTWIIFLGLLSYGGLLLSGARFSFALTFVTLLVSFFLVGKKKLIALLFVLAFLSVVVPSPLQKRLLLTLPTNVTKVSSDTKQISELKQSSSTRLDKEWPNALHAFKSDPLIGHGYSSLGQSIDNTYLRILGETGIAGLGALLFLLYIIFRRLSHQVKAKDQLNRYLAISTLVMMLGFLLNGIVIDVFQASKIATVFWYTVGLTLTKL